MGFALSLGKLNIAIGMNATKFNQGVRMVQTKLVKLGQDIQKFGSKISSIGRNLALKVTAPIVLMGVAAVKSFADFDDAMTKSLAIMGDVAPAMRQEMRDLAISMSNETVTSAKDLADSFFFLASAGLSAEQSMKSLSTVNAFAIAGNFDMALATDLLTDAQSALGLTVKDTAKNTKNMVKVSDTLIKANTLANATAEQFAKSLTTKSAASLRLLNKDLTEGVAVLAAFADQGVKGELAGERLSIVLRDLQKSSINAEGAWDALGLSVFDASGKMKPIANIVRQLEGALGNATDKQKKMTLTTLGFQERSVSAIQSLLGLSDKIEEYEGKLKKAAGTTKDIAEKQAKSFTAQMIIMKNKIVNVGIAIGAKLAPLLLKLNVFLEKGIKAWENLNNEQKNAVLIFAGIAAAIGPVLIGLGALITLVGAAVVSLATLATSFLPITLATIGLTALFAALVSQLVGPDSLSDGFDFAKDTALKFFKEVLGFSDETLKKFNKIFEGIKLGFDTAALAGTLFVDGILLAFKFMALGIAAIIGTTFEFILKGFRGMKKQAAKLLISIGKGLTGVRFGGDKIGRKALSAGKVLQTEIRGDEIESPASKNVINRFADWIQKSMENNAVAMRDATVQFGKSVESFKNADKDFDNSKLLADSKFGASIDAQIALAKDLQKRAIGDVKGLSPEAAIEKRIVDALRIKREKDEKAEAAKAKTAKLPKVAKGKSSKELAANLKLIEDAAKLKAQTEKDAAILAAKIKIDVSGLNFEQITTKINEAIRVKSGVLNFEETINKRMNEALGMGASAADIKQLTFGEDAIKIINKSIDDLRAKTGKAPAEFNEKVNERTGLGAILKLFEDAKKPKIPVLPKVTKEAEIKQNKTQEAIDSVGKTFEQKNLRRFTLENSVSTAPKKEQVVSDPVVASKLDTLIDVTLNKKPPIAVAG